MIKPKLKKGTLSLQFNEETARWFSKEVYKHTGLDVSETPDAWVVSEDGSDYSEPIFDNQWLVVYPNKNFDIMSEWEYVSKHD